jgi:glutathione S-transferase
MVLKLYGSPVSGAVRLVAFVLREKHVPFELVPIDFSKKEQKSPEYVEKQPFGQVPCIVRDVLWLRSIIFLTECTWYHSLGFDYFFFQDDDGFILYESRAICYYIAAKYPDQGTPLLPTELKANALFQQAASVEIYHFTDHVLKAAEETIIKS